MTQMVLQEKKELAPPNPTPMQILQMAVQGGAAIDTIERLAKLQREMLEYDAKVAFNQAIADCQREMGRVGADATNPQTRSKYATYAKLDSALRPIYTRHGLALSFDTDEAESEKLKVLCHVTHQLGHSQTFRITMPADGKGAKGGDVMTKTHATGAAASYGMRYLLRMIFNVAVGEEDHDGNVHSGSMPDQQYIAFEERISGADTVDALKEAYGEAQRAAQTSGDRQAASSFENAKNKRYRDLVPR